MACVLFGEPPLVAAMVIDALAVASLYWCHEPLRPSRDGHVMPIVPVPVTVPGMTPSKSSSVRKPPLPTDVPQLPSVQVVAHLPSSGPVYVPDHPHAWVLPPEPPVPLEPLAPPCPPAPPAPVLLPPPPVLVVVVVHPPVPLPVPVVVVPTPVVLPPVVAVYPLPPAPLEGPPPVVLPLTPPVSPPAGPPTSSLQAF